MKSQETCAMKACNKHKYEKKSQSDSINLCVYRKTSPSNMNRSVRFSCAGEQIAVMVFVFSVRYCVRAGSVIKVHAVVDCSLLVSVLLVLSLAYLNHSP